MMKQIITLCLLVVSLIGCVPSATSTPIPPTPNARATETQIAANIFATQTASVPTATNAPLVTATPTLPAGVLFSEEFGSEKTTVDRGWSLGLSNDGGIARTWAPNQYTLSVNRTDWIAYQWPSGTYDNFGAEIDARATTAYAEYGIAFRINSSAALSSYYVFGVTTDGNCRLRKNIDGQWANNALVPLTASEKINPGLGKNTLGVLADGATISLYLNGFLVSTVNEASIANGSIGVYASTASNTHSEVVFSRLTIYTVEKAQVIMGNTQAPLGTRTPTPKPSLSPTPKPSPSSTRSPLPTLPPVPTMVPAPALPSCKDTPAGMAGLLWINQFDGEVTVTIVDHEYHVPGNSRMMIPIPPDKKFVIDAFIPGIGRLRPAPGPFTWGVGYCEVWNPGRS